VITNYHVVYDTSGLSVTFSNGNGYSATVLGTDPYADLAMLSVDAPSKEFQPIEIVSSSTLQVGDPVIAIGNPYGLVGSLTTGVVSALGRTITEDYAGGFAIANIIQTSAPINPGNSGGPLVNMLGEVVGMNTAIVSGSSGVGFAIPSDTINRELQALLTTGKYEHPWLGLSGNDIDTDIAKAIALNCTYGILITDLTKSGPVEKAGLQGGTTTMNIGGNSIKVGGDVIVEIDGLKVRNFNDLSVYLERNTRPEDTITLTLIRNSQKLTKEVVLGVRP
jgi:S1-C subfamily serine protease